MQLSSMYTYPTFFSLPLDLMKRYADPVKLIMITNNMTRNLYKSLKTITANVLE